MAADSAFQRVWSGAAFVDRARIVGRAASLMLERKENLARLATIEMGKRIAESRDEVELSAAILLYYADHAEALLAPQAIETSMGDAHVEFSPLGVLLGVQPWNFPYYQLARFAAPNLMAGNTLLVKHASSVRNAHSPSSKFSRTPGRLAASTRTSSFQAIRSAH